MAVISTTAMTLADWAARLSPDGKNIAMIIELLKQTNSILEDMMWVEGNLATGHKTTVRSGLPDVTWRMLNYGVQPSKSRTVQVTDTCGMLETYAQVDKDLADLNGNTAEFRLGEDRAFIEAMNQEMAKTLFYGDTDKDQEKFMGLSPRYSTTANNTENAKNIIGGGGSTAAKNTSIWLVVWSDLTCHGIFPKGKISGLQHKDLGEVTLTDSNNGLYQGYRSHYKWDAGLCLRDWRYVVRICNIDVTTLTTSGSGNSANLITLMIRAIHKLPSRSMGRPVFYCNSDAYTYLDLQTLARSNNALTYGPDVHGREIMKFRGIPVRECDAISSKEDAVTIS